MADNTTLNPGVGGDTIAADDVGGVKYQVVKLDLGADGASSPVSGALPVSGTFWQATQPVSGPVTDAQLRATPVPVSGTVTANTGLTQPLTDAQLRATAVPVSGTVSTGLTQPLTDAQLRATPVPVSGTVTANTGLSQPLTDAQIRATALPVSGTVAVSNMIAQGLTDAELRATAVTVSGPVTDAQLRASAVPVSGPLTDTQLRAAAVVVDGEVALDSATISALTTGGALTDVQLRATPVPVDVAGELLEALEAMRFAVQALTRSMGQMLPDAASRMRVNIETGTLPTVTTVTTVATLTNQTLIGGLAATEQIPSLMRLGADSLRRNISVN
jgi:hypothetical protein